MKVTIDRSANQYMVTIDGGRSELNCLSVLNTTMVYDGIATLEVEAETLTTSEQYKQELSLHEARPSKKRIFIERFDENEYRIGVIHPEEGIKEPAVMHSELENMRQINIRLSLTPSDPTRFDKSFTFGITLYDVNFDSTR